MAWWKESFEKINSELELVRKKKEALENLLNSGRISQSTYEYYSKELEEAEKDIENRRKALIEKVNLRMENLEKQLQVLEMLFADVEISHAVGELDDETYTRQRDTLAAGLDFAKKELDSLKEFTFNLETPSVEQASEQVVVEAEEQAAEVTAEGAVEEQVEERLSTEGVETIETPQEEMPQEQPSETVEQPETSVEGITFQTAKGESEGTEEHVET